MWVKELTLSVSLNAKHHFAHITQQIRRNLTNNLTAHLASQTVSPPGQLCTNDLMIEALSREGWQLDEIC